VKPDVVERLKKLKGEFIQDVHRSRAK